MDVFFILKLKVKKPLRTPEKKSAEMERKEQVDHLLNLS